MKRGHESPERMSTKSFKKAAFLLSLITLVLQIIAYSSNGWRIIESGSTTTMIGLWYTTVCIGDSECKSYSKLERYKDSLNEMSYSYVVRAQIVSTTAVFCSIVCFLLSIVTLQSEHREKQIRLGTIVLSMISGVGWLYEPSLELRRFQIDVLNKPEDSSYSIFLPYSVFIGLIGAVMSISLGCLVLSKECKTTIHSKIHSKK